MPSQSRIDHALDIDDIACPVLVDVGGAGRDAERLIDFQLDVHDVCGSVPIDVAGRRGRAPGNKLVRSPVPDAIGTAGGAFWIQVIGCGQRLSRICQDSEKTGAPDISPDRVSGKLTEAPADDENAR